MKFIRLFCVLVFPFYLLSCSTQQRIPHYLENVTDTAIKEAVKFPELRIQKDDDLFIQVYDNSLNSEVASKPWNLPSASGASGTGSSTNSFVVDVNGNIEYPRIGKIHVEGMTKKELADMIKNKASKELTDPHVIIRFLNFKIIVLGEVVSQGIVNSKGEKLTILEAIGQAGGITEFGNKTNVKVIRQTGGEQEIGIINLASKAMFESPYYNLVQNDIILIDPTNQKTKQTDEARTFQRISFAVSMITAAAVIYNIFK